MEKAAIHQLLDNFLDSFDHDIFVLSPDKFEELKKALPPMYRTELEEIGPSKCEYLGIWYPCIAYRSSAFINAQDIISKK